MTQQIGGRQDRYEEQARQQREKATALLGKQRLSSFELGALQAAARASGDVGLQQQAAERVQRARQARRAKGGNRPATQADVDKLLNDWRSDWQKSLDEAFRAAMDD